MRRADRKKEKKEMEKRAKNLNRVFADYQQGLSLDQVEERQRAGAVNVMPQTITRSVGKIVADNVLTLFNLLNFVLAAAIIWVGQWTNVLFLGVAISNTAIGLFQEIRAKKTVDRLSILARSKITVVRQGENLLVDPDEVVLDEVLVLTAGDQICADGKMIFSRGVEVDESLLTGESETVKKPEGADVLSGSFLVAGSGYMRATAVGANSYAAKLSLEAKKEKKQKSELMRTLTNLIRLLTVIIVPLGIALFYFQRSKGTSLENAVLGASAAMLGMIPDGLMLLTGVSFAIGAMNLARHKTLVQTMPSIETLARVDVLCLDKTGTITDGTMQVEKVILTGDLPLAEVSRAVAELMSALGDKNTTAKALRGYFREEPSWTAEKIVPFSSKRKWSGVHFGERGSFLLGAPEFLFTHLGPEIQSQIDGYAASGLRVLVLGFGQKSIDHGDPPDDLRLVALILLSDNVRQTAATTFAYFREQGVAIKVISGDNPVTVSSIAKRAGLEIGDRFIDMSTLAEEADLTTIAEENTVFGRVSPYQKRELIRALQRNGHITCMTGDGVNDVLALKEADCGVAMAGGGNAAQSVADFVLLDADFAAMIEVFKEGRRVINNIEQVASLYLVKTIYSTLFSILYIFIPYPYPFAPIQLSPVNQITVGVPSFLLTLRPKYEKPAGHFLKNILDHSLPAGLTVVFSVLVLQLAGIFFELSQAEVSTMNVLLTGTIGFILLFGMGKPFTKGKGFIFGALVAVFLSYFMLFGNIFSLTSLYTRNVFFYLPLMLSATTIFNMLSKLVLHLTDLFSKSLGKWKKRRVKGKKPR